MFEAETLVPPRPRTVGTLTSRDRKITFVNAADFPVMLARFHRSMRTSLPLGSGFAFRWVNGVAFQSALLSAAILVLGWAAPLALSAQTTGVSPAVAPGLPSLTLPSALGGSMQQPMQTGVQGIRTAGQPQQAAPDDTAATKPDQADANRSRQSGPADHSTDFQLLVQSTTGQSLPIFGTSLFDNVPSTFAPVDNTPVAPDYILGTGDELRVNLFGQVNQRDAYTIDRTGAIFIAGVGPVPVAGLRFGDLAGLLKSQYAKLYRNFDLTVNLGQLRTIPIFVLGQARRPGMYTISSISTLVNALFASGGVLPQGSLRNIQVLRGGKVAVTFDLYDLLLRGDKSKDIKLEPGDEIFIPIVGPQVAIIGSIFNPAIYEIKPGTRLDELLQYAGGGTSVATLTRVRLDRIFEHSMRTIADVDLAKGQNPLLDNGDILSIPSIVDRFNDAVTLRGNVANPGRYVWHPGMRISDLIPNKESLITRDYFRRRNSLGMFVTDYDTNQQSTQQGALQARASSADAATAAQRVSGTSTTGAGGTSVANALTANDSTFGPRTDVVISAPDINWSYAVIEHQNPADLTTTLIPFNLGKLILDGDQSQNLALSSGDVVTIFSTADIRVPMEQQTRFVRLEGEFVAAGVYSVLPGETLRQLLKRAGGFAPDAYLYGSDFTRASTRRVERQRLLEYADALEAQVTAYTATSSARAVTADDAAASVAGTGDARRAIARLRQLEPEGRIVLPLKPDSQGIDAVPDLALEDGDRFVVPRQPAVVNVQGQVYSANAFLYQPGHETRDFLKMAGGPDRLADKKRAFILRADGSIFSRQYGNFDRARIFPGDTIVVPPLLDRRAILRNLIDISTVVGQFGLGAAAINVLK